MNIIVTGASRGLGYETALQLISKGHRVIALARSGEKLKQLQTTARGQAEQLHPLTFDLLKDSDELLVQLIEEQFNSKVDVLINNVGTMINKAFRELDDKDFQELWRGNFLTAVQMIRRTLPFLSTGSHIVNIGSMGGFQGSAKFPGLTAYSASKAALHNLTECLATELAEEAIRVNCLALGSAQTEMLEQAFPGYQSPLSAMEMAAFIADFAVNKGAFFNGKILPVAVSVP